MKSLRPIYFANLLLLVLMFQSCGSSNNVVSNRLIQKRKFNKGWHINSTKRQKQSTTSAQVDPKHKNEEKTNSQSNRSTRTKESSSELEEIELRTTSDVEIEVTNDSEIDSDITSTTETKSEHASNEDVEPTETIKDNNILFDPPAIAMAKYNYKRSWMFTIAALVAIFAGIILISGAWGIIEMIFGFVLIGVAVTAYVFMFINLARAARFAGTPNDDNKVIRFFIWAHVFIGSLVSILLFFIPLTAVIVNVKRSRR